MSAHSNFKNPLAAYYDRVILVLAVVALLASVGVFFQSLGQDPAESAEAALSRIERQKSDESGVKSVDLADYEKALSSIRKPMRMPALPVKGGNVFASDCHIVCPNTECKAIMPFDKDLPKDAQHCWKCGKSPEKEIVVEKDADHDGMLDVWEYHYGLNPQDPSDANKDLDGDGFTNIEEYNSGTNPADPASHPDYLDSLKIVLPLKETFVPFIFQSAMKVPAGVRMQFFDPKKKNDYGTRGTTYSVLEGEAIGNTGFIAEKYVQQQERVKIAGGSGAKREVDTSFAVIKRSSDGKEVELKVDQKKVAVDTLATLAYSRGDQSEMVVKVGDEIDLSGTKYAIKGIRLENKRILVTVAPLAPGLKGRTLEAALEE